MPEVSIIVPCFNEEQTIQLLLQSIYQQTVSIDRLEVVISDGLSTDRTRQKIDEFIISHPGLSVRVVENSKRTIPSALNRAIEESTGEYIIRLDAHSVPANNYVELCLHDLDEGKGDNVGGVWDIKPQGDNLIAKSIAIGASHKLGVGDARYRYTNQAGWVDTVPFGAFKRDIVKQVGLFDESLLTNEDYEFNVRIRKHGGHIWLNPAIRAVYFSRPDIPSLAVQYWRYGLWKWLMLRKNPGTIKWRQFLPPFFVSSLIGLIILGILTPVFWMLLVLEIFIYFFILLAASFWEGYKIKDLRVGFPVALSIATMHFCWGTGFLWSMVKSLFVRKT